MTLPDRLLRALAPSRLEIRSPPGETIERKRRGRSKKTNPVIPGGTGTPIARPSDWKRNKAREGVYNGGGTSR